MAARGGALPLEGLQSRGGIIGFCDNHMRAAVPARPPLFSNRRMTRLLVSSVRHQDAESDLVCAKWLRAHGAPWPEVLSCWTEFDDQPCFGDWPEVAVSWCRAEGCTSPLWTEFLNAETESESSNHDGSAWHADTDSNVDADSDAGE